MKQLKAVIFDVDGTLAETERYGHRVAFNRAFAEAGLDWHWDEHLYAQLLAVAGGKERIAFYLKKTGLYDELADKQSLIAKLHKLKTAQYADLLSHKQVRLRHGVARLINEIRNAGIRLAIATTTTETNVLALLSATMGDDSLKWFDCIAAGDVVARKKPAADIFHYCLHELRLTADDCLAIEDSAHGLSAATAAGIRTIITVNDYTRNDDFSNAVAVVSELGEPNHPIQQLAGVKFDNNYVNVEVLKALHANEI